MEKSVFVKKVIRSQEAFNSLPIQCLKEAAGEYNSRSISRIINSLKENGYHTFGDVIDATSLDLINSRNFGPRGLEIVTSLMDQMYEHPELISKNLNGGISCRIKTE
ncbi:DNA-directed RNA polymerase subunit alpha C-terminal domain-containing protein [Paenibacillus tianjinensis]|uniref:RNA polymerase alpha subunit C-terminal domain-containing protein n=1 Tax=Paenibacillus tianjinensis TaxID=2810347 RepID=A0ABX7LI34_9BACL|nr:DNA-directed RNA polymerase subunit alpha C-terminal domain-containing protein [Paenibacillus tianjinensis]QSF46639.1 hypothetical protein JRJ22_08755 [Paenibacillus tianjinensis]